MTNIPSVAAPAAPVSVPIWRSPLIIIGFGCAIGALTFGPRSTFGFFMKPMSADFGWGREIFALAFAIQNLMWGVCQPFAGAMADRFGARRIMSAGALLYALGLVLMVYADTPLSLILSCGLLIGIGLSGSSFTIIVAAFGKLVPPERLSIALGLATAAGSFGQLLFAPMSVALIGAMSWQGTLLVFSSLVILVLPFCLPLATPKTDAAASVAVSGRPQSLSHALGEAFRHRSYVLLLTGFFTCGFQLAFVTAHLPAYLMDRGLSAEVGGWVLAAIGLFNIVGSLLSGWLGNRMPRRYILSFIYFGRALVTAAFILLPVSPTSAILFGAVTGLFWLSTVPPTSGLVSVMFGTQWMAMLFGFTFFSHQVGGFLGAWIGGIAYERTGSYDIVWWFSILLGVLSALINLPIVEKPVERLVPQRA